MVKKGRIRVLTALLLVVGSFSAPAKEGMWLPPQIKKREADMRALGMRIPVEQLYNEQGTGLNNAVVLFGSGCTAEVVSDKGLLLTNHHCGYGTVQGLSSGQNDYFANGFWAMSMDQELPCPGLTVTFVRKMENVSSNILSGMAPDTLAEAHRDSVIAIRIRNLERGYQKIYPQYKISIQPFYNGNQYWAILTETYSDIRLVAFPPNGIGNFGGDVDNWMWPRHTGDFSMFRIYANASNQPAAYSKDNQPYKPVRYFPVATSGYKEGDFTMVYGFPGSTQQYISSEQLGQVTGIMDPIRIDVRTQKLRIWKDAMEKDRAVFLKYTAKKNGISNGWKKWQGELRGLELNDVAGIKRNREYEFQQWASSDSSRKASQLLLSRITASVSASNEALVAEEFIREAVLGIELIAQGAQLDRMLQAYRKKSNAQALQQELQNMKGSWESFYKNYDDPTDQKVFVALMPMFIENNPGYVPDYYRTMLTVNKNNYDRWAANVYKSSLITHPDRVLKMLDKSNYADTLLLRSDPAWQLYHAIQEVRETEVRPRLRNYQEQMRPLNRQYMAAQMKQRFMTDFYSDANLTLRIAYGQVQGIDPEGPAGYSYQTTLDEVMAKDQPGSMDFNVPEKLKEVYQQKDFGRWAVNGTVPVAFTASNHTTGGNSGSPVLNAKGQLIGINFDRIWEGTMSDLYFDPKLSRNISVDIRYVLFVIEKVGGAGWLLKEMKLEK